jgi:hypothetical protein
MNQWFDSNMATTKDRAPQIMGKIDSHASDATVIQNDNIRKSISLGHYLVTLELANKEGNVSPKANRPAKPGPSHVEPTFLALRQAISRITGITIIRSTACRNYHPMVLSLLVTRIV